MTKAKAKAPKKTPSGSNDPAVVYKSLQEIVNVIVQAHKEAKSINLTRIKSEICAKNRCATQPKTVDIINAIPDEYKKALISKIKAKPVRTASGV